MKKIITIVVATMVCLVLAFVVSFALTDGFNRRPQGFWLVHNGKGIYESTMELNKNEEYLFKCSFVAGFINCASPAKGYQVFIYPNLKAKEFNYTVDGVSKSFKNTGDLTAGFNIQYLDTSFTLSVNKSMQQILIAAHEGSEVLAPETDLADDYYFTLIVSNKSGNSFVYIDFKVEP